MSSLRSQVLRELVTEYRAQTDVDVKKRIFCTILARVDKLIIKKVDEQKRRKQQLSKIPAQDLYHTAILGLHRAIMSAKETDSGDTIQARIISYVKEEIRLGFLGKKREMHTVDPSVITNCMLQYEQVYGVESREIMDKLWEMVDSGVINKSDMGMLIDNSVNGKSYSRIGKEKGIHYTTVSNRIKRLKKLILEKLGLDQ